MKIKASKKIIMAALALLMAVGLAAGSTFAWFSMNNTVKVDGMEVRTKVTSNLLVSPDQTETNFGTTLAQGKKALLEPVSTTDGLTFFYTATDNVVANGDAKVDTYTEYTTPAAFATAYGVDGAVPYVDYTMYLKATSTADNSKVVLNKCNLLYNNAAIATTERAFRVAVFANASADKAANASAISTTPSNLISILDFSDSANFVENNAVTSETALGTVSEHDQYVVVDDDLDSGHWKYYGITVRLWLEGEDKTCKVDTFATLTGAWSLDLGFTIDTSATGVNVISSVISEGDPFTFAVVAATDNAGVTVTDGKLSNGVEPSTFEWHKAVDDTVVVESTAKDIPTTAGEYYCIITGADGQQYITPVITKS